MNERSEAGRLARPVPVELRRVAQNVTPDQDGADFVLATYAKLYGGAFVRMWRLHPEEPQDSRWVVEAFLPTEQETG